ncbi:TetR/AcrR family transcriptional regulator [Curtobacterium sp. MCSS17_007]|uniref:TetR/AcrR family transcriptional regulator n=1 Tax=Curtobacterium sp. MCSS17_007 TaxID=2175646 RepID=UPI000DA7BF79|nr:TetR/AcrR family transcriptional regulator [Curtobacterium sp. MCSS17_007]WIE75646.1 TetR/AcrR family transcriptional regulator [Curtobacterium sp. MCSS17_007]
MSTPAPDRPVRRRSSTRAQLVAAAEAVFDETGTTAVSVEAIVTRAGFTRGAFYSNFRSVDELFFAVYEQQAALVSELLGGMLDDARAAEHPSLDDVVRGVVGGLPPEEKWYAIRSVLITRARHDETVNRLLREHTDHFHDTLQPLLVGSLARIGLRPTVDPALFTRAVVAAHVGAVSQSVLHDDTEQVRVTAVEGCILGLTEPLPEESRAVR